MISTSLFSREPKMPLTLNGKWGKGKAKPCIVITAILFSFTLVLL